MKKNNTNLYNKAFKKFTLGILYIVFIAYTLSILLYNLPYPLIYVLLIGCTLNITPIIIVHFIPINYIKKSIKAYLIAALIPMHFITIICLLKGVVTPLFWYIVIPIYLYTAFPFKNAFKWSVLCICLMLCTFIITFILQYAVYDNAPINYPDMSLFQMLFSEMINALLTLVAVGYCLYYIHYFHQIQIGQIENAVDSTNSKENLSTILDNEDDHKYKKIYQQITNYIETRQPYLNSNFKITQMGYDLDINAAYLAKAIRKNKNMNFNNLVNCYRVEKAKELIQGNTSKYTLEYIYMSSGFSSQSSFNRAFKQQMNITPSEYYKQITNTK